MTSVTSPAMSRKTILWFRNDLRISDNPMLNLVASRGQQQQKQQSHQQHQSQQQPQLQQQQQPQNTHETHDLLCVYCFDPRTYAPPATRRKDGHLQSTIHYTERGEPPKQPAQHRVRAAGLYGTARGPNSHST
eukprot:CAMPEP_0173202384 /NCGR_PEP_ID=MMETSP1141-20130122/18938_1 /TAXON_ID=483371 /ORGANISM="non described non described, Strain CCMP2298" /LENGTH=132 /DNA_ID=CAMNT_0014127733 /DNA_START=136 /DNA_END=535 /DNA_ORIENTATION=+